MGPNKVLNSLWSVDVILLQIREYREGKSQYAEGNKRIPKKVLNQLRDRFIILLEGSKTEKRFVITFNLEI